MRIDRFGAGNGVSVGIENRKMAGAAVVANSMAAVSPGRLRSLEVDFCSQLLGVFTAREPLNRDFRVVCVAKKGSPVGKGVLEAFRQGVEIERRNGGEFAEAHLWPLPFESRQDVQCFELPDSTTGWGWHREDRERSIFAFERLAHGWLDRLQVLERNQAAASAHLGDNRLGDLSA